MYLLSLIHYQQRTRSVDGGGDRRGGVQGNAVSPVGHTAHIRASTILAAHSPISIAIVNGYDEYKLQHVLSPFLS